jgi:hypothetical protein
VTATAAGNAAFSTTGGAGAIPVNPGDVISIQARFRPVTTPRSVRLDISWWTAAGAFISSSVGVAVVEAAGWGDPVHTKAAAPATAAFASLSGTLLNCAAGEAHDVDVAQLEKGGPTEWSPGGAPVFAQDCHIEGIDHDVTPGASWSTTWHLVPADPIGFWILGDSTFGVLGSTTRLGY